MQESVGEFVMDQENGPTHLRRISKLGLVYLPLPDDLSKPESAESEWDLIFDSSKC